jgi:fructoselysine-6-P-deglycase FrlB-like protein
MKTYTNQDIWKAKIEARHKRALEPFEHKLLALIRMQMMDYSIALSTGRTPHKPWHFDDKERMEKYARAGAKLY